MRLQGIHKRFGEMVLYDGLVFSPVEKGVTCLLGPSGCGKTTLLNLAAGLILPDSGSVEESGRVSYVFQEERLLPWETVEFNAMYAMDHALSATERREKIGELLEALEIADASDKYPAQISGGMARRTALARALAAPFDTLLLDEPFSSLDRDLRMRIVERVRPRLSGKTVILVTHDYATAQALSDSIYRLSMPPVRLTSVDKADVKSALDRIKRMDSD